VSLDEVNVWETLDCSASRVAMETLMQRLKGAELATQAYLGAPASITTTLPHRLLGVQLTRDIHFGDFSKPHTASLDVENATSPPGVVSSSSVYKTSRLYQQAVSFFINSQVFPDQPTRQEYPKPAPTFLNFITSQLCHHQPGLRPIVPT